MALPIQKTATYVTTVPSTKKQVKFRPFLVKEEKALLLAQQSDDQTVMMETLKKVLKDCVEGIDADTLATFDIEYLFSQIRAKSVGEVVDLVLRCDTCEDEKAKVKVSIDLTKLEVNIPEGHSKNIKLFDDVGIVMKYPNIELIKTLESVDTTNDAEAIFDVIVHSIEYIYAGEELHYAHEQKKEDLHQFIENLTQEQFRKIQKFFEEMPKLEKQVDYTCPVCNKNQSILVSGLDSFF